jgi:hypothetical protein
VAEADALHENAVIDQQIDFLVQLHTSSGMDPIEQLFSSEEEEEEKEARTQ